ncbi:MAG: hypothetical protein H0Z33_06815 [Bacillaceae bacterium]|nr:hypothetical protein [Bacillaceae bacterium]
MIWMNVDRPMKTCTIHADPVCPYVRKKRETDYKGVERLKRDGGWLSFDSLLEAREYHLSQFDDYSLKQHCGAAEREKTAPVQGSTVAKVSGSDNPSINSVTDHYQKIVGLPGKKVPLTTMPRWLRIFYYVVVGVLGVGGVIGLVYVITSQGTG